MKLKLLLIFFLWDFYTYSQNIEDISAKHVEPYVIEFTLEDSSSVGYQFLEKLVAEHDYFLLGEYHFSNNIQLLASEICKLGNRYGYTDFICENGRYSTKFLNEIYTNNSNVEMALTNYFKPIKTMVSFEDEIEINNPIAFLTTKEEVVLLNKLKKYNYQLLGIDQEYYFSTKLFISELAKISSIRYDKINSLYVRLDSLSKKISIPNFNYCEEILKDTLIVNFLKSYKEHKWQTVYNAWKESMQIYYGKRRHSRRISMMRRNFIEQIAPRFVSNQDLKIIVKLGALHTSKGLTDYGVYDIGDLVSRFAEVNGKKSIHARCAKRFYLNEGDTIDFCKAEPNYGDKLLRKFGKKDKWVIIDLRKIRKDYHNGKFNIPEFLVNNELKYILDYNDIYIISPLDKSIVEL